MIRRYKAIGIALAAILALSALAAQAASASPLTVEGAGTASYTGDQDVGVWEFKDPGGVAAKCTSATIAGTTTGTNVNETTYTANYTSCTGFGFAVMDWNQNNCTYTFTTPTQIKPGEVTWHGSGIHIVCPAGKSLEYTPTSFGVSACTRLIPSQTPTGGHVVGRNVAGSSPKDVTLEIKLSGIHYTGTGGLCGNGETHSDLTWTGNSTIRAYSNGGHNSQLGITYS